MGLYKAESLPAETASKCHEFEEDILRSMPGNYYRYDKKCNTGMWPENDKMF